MTDNEKDIRDRQARLQAMLDLLDRETERMRQLQARQRRERKMRTRQR